MIVWWGNVDMPTEEKLTAQPSLLSYYSSVLTLCVMVTRDVSVHASAGTTQHATREFTLVTLQQGYQ